MINPPFFRRQDITYIMSILLSGNCSKLKRLQLVIADLTALRSCEKSFKGSEASAQDLSVHFERRLF